MKLTEDKIKFTEDGVKPGLKIRAAEIKDVHLILEFVKGIARFENLSHLVTATEETLADAMFGNKPYAEVFFAELDGVPVGFTVFFHNFSTFVGKPGLYIEDIFVKPEFRGKGIGKAMFLHCVKLAKERNCGRIEWAVLEWNLQGNFTNILEEALQMGGRFIGWMKKNLKVHLKNEFEVKFLNRAKVGF
ncbi:GNAT family N-acetyltransferase [Methanosarcina barkeri]|uniref:GNAT family N-acetyltransferase n=1 Tax=Methanosarcina barkeri TaxID=2208 RepID=UPI001FB35BA0|nr:GNAT family N-acetyltransferase [Methanosarcina barkeri]